MSDAMPGRLCIMLGSGASITCEAPDIDEVLSKLTAALDAYYSEYWTPWSRHRKSTVQILGTPNVTIPIERILSFYVERIDEAKGGTT